MCHLSDSLSVMLGSAAENISQLWCLWFRPITPGDDRGKLGHFPGRSSLFQVEKLRPGAQDPVTEFVQSLGP